jgi:hypothetical protein
MYSRRADTGTLNSRIACYKDLLEKNGTDQGILGIQLRCRAKYWDPDE